MRVAQLLRQRDHRKLAAVRGAGELEHGALAVVEHGGVAHEEADGGAAAAAVA